MMTRSPRDVLADYMRVFVNATAEDVLRALEEAGYRVERVKDVPDVKVPGPHEAQEPYELSVAKAAEAKTAERTQKGSEDEGVVWEGGEEGVWEEDTRSKSKKRR